MTKNSKILIWTLTASLIISLTGLLFVLYLYRQQQINFDQQKLALQSSLNNQKKDKDTISFIWEEQAAQNDTLVLKQLAVIDNINSYLANIQKSIRFVNTVPQITADANESNFQSQLNSLQSSIKDLNAVTIENNAKKDEYKTKIETIYQQSGEDLKNRANPDGIKS